MKKTLLVALIVLPITGNTAPLDCHSWPMSMAEVYLKNEKIVAITQLDESRTEIKQLASEKKGKNLYNQIYHFIFHIS